MTLLISLFVLSLIVGLVVSNLSTTKDPIADNYKRWSEEELFITSFVAIFVIDEVRLNKKFQNLLANTLLRTTRATSEKIRRLNTTTSVKSDASKKDLEVVYAIAELDEYDATEKFVESLLAVGATKRQVKSLLQYI